MPTLKDIEQFKSSLFELGREQETLARWGERLEDLPPPSQAVSDDLASLLEPLADDEAPPPDLGLDAASGDEPDFSSFLEDIPLETLPDAPAADDGGPAGFDDADFASSGYEAGGGFGGADDQFGVPDALLSGLGDELGEEPGEDLAEDPFASLAGESLEAAEAGSGAEAPEELSELGDFSMPDFAEEGPAGADDGFADLSAAPADASADTSADAFADAGGEAPKSEPVEELSELGDFSMPDFGDEAAAPDGGASAATGGYEAADEFAMPDFSVPEPDEAEPEQEAGMDLPGDLPADSPADSFAAEEFSLGSESLEGDSFDQFKLGGADTMDFGGTALPELGDNDFAPPKDDIDSQLAALDGGLPSSDNFSLDGGWGADFSIPGFEMGEAPPKKAEKKPSPAAIASMEAAFGAGAPKPHEAKPIDLNEAQVDALQDSLLSYPLNLRLAVEDIIANAKGSDEQQSALIWLLVGRGSARDAAKLAGKILKRYIEIPAGFEKRTGAAFEAEKGSLAYAFKHSILPMLQAIVLAAAAATALFFLGYNFAYRPIKAGSLYAEGHRQIEQKLYRESETLFDRADLLWTMKRWHYRYAQAYAEAGQYPRAQAMYERLLRRWPRETAAALEYATMESVELQSFEKAESVLQRFVLERDYFNKDALLLSADNFMAWADFEEQRYEGPDTALIQSLYENARRRLAIIMEKHGRSDGYLERMLVYFMRVERAGAADKAGEVEALAKYFDENKRSLFSAATLAETAQYLMDKDRLDFVNRLLLAAVDRDGRYPESYAALARLNRRTGFPDEELKALELSARFFGEADRQGPLSQRRIRAYLDSLIRLGEVRIAAAESLAAEEVLADAIARYERAVTERILRREATFGKAYSLMGDLHFLGRRDFQSAEALYAKAEYDGYLTPDTDYRRGYMQYYGQNPNPEQALGFFHRAGLDREPSPYLLWASANALFERGDFFAAQGYFTMLVERLQFELSTITLIEPQYRPSHEEIVELLAMAQNNLGVSLYRVADRMGDASRRAGAMVAFTESARLYDSLSRDQLSMLRSESRNLGFLNLDFVLHPLRGIDIAIYRQLPLDMSYPRK
jgi:hypothetical protein